MTAPVVLAEIGKHSTFFAGDVGLVHAAISTVGCRKQYDRKRRAIAVPASSSDDVMAALELRFGADIQLVQAIS